MRNPTTVAAPPLHCADHTCAAGSSPIPSFAISSVQPRGGPTAGGTKVQLRGRGLHELVDCAFGPYPRSRAFAVDPDPGAWAVGGVWQATPPVPVGEVWARQVRNLLNCFQKKGDLAQSIRLQALLSKHHRRAVLRPGTEAGGLLAAGTDAGPDLQRLLSLVLQMGQ